MKKWRLIGGVALVFVLGVLVGSLGTQLYHKRWLERSWKDPAARSAVFLRRLTKELRLTEEQQKEFKVMIEEVDKKLEAVNRQKRADIKGILDDSFSHMTERLDPDRQKKLEELRARREKRTSHGMFSKTPAAP